MNKSLKIIFAVSLSVAIHDGFSQTVNDVPVADIDVKYIEIVGTEKLMSQKVDIALHFGQENKLWSAKDTQLKDKDGKLKTFNSMIDALNYMDGLGYEFVQSYAVTIGNQNVYRYLMKRKE